MTAADLYGITKALDGLLSRDLPVAVAIPAAQARKLAAETFAPFGEKVEEIKAKKYAPEVLELSIKKALAEEVCVDLPTVTVPPMLMLPGAVVAVLVEAGVLEVAS